MLGVNRKCLLQKSSDVNRTGITEPNITPIAKPEELHTDEKPTLTLVKTMFTIICN